jgi:hypothetical protein
LIAGSEAQSLAEIVKIALAAATIGLSDTGGRGTPGSSSVVRLVEAGAVAAAALVVG